MIQDQFNYQKQIFLKTFFFLMQIHKAFRTVKSEGMGNSGEKSLKKSIISIFLACVLWGHEG